MSVFRAKNSPYYQYEFHVKGCRFRGTTRTTNRRAAEAIEARLKTEAAGDIVKRRAPMTLDVAAGRYAEEVSQHQPSARNVDHQFDLLLPGLDPKGHGKELLLSEIDGDKLAGYIGKRRAQVSNATVNRELGLVRRMMRRADQVWKADVGEMPNWKALMMPESAGRVRSLTEDEERRLFTHLRADFQPMVRFGMLTGMRLANVIGLTWEQVDFEEEVIKLQVKSNKPGGEPMVLPITPLALTILHGEFGNHPTRVFTYKCARGRQGRRKGLRYPFTAFGWRKAWAEALTAAKVKDFRFHDLRHTAATRTLRASKNLRAVQKMLGHKSIVTTTRYTHADVDDVRDAMVAAETQNFPRLRLVEKPKALKQKD